ncbi:hypothetical protein EPUS_05952 [Endocarpon pusillum Z07020]|uniref:Fungal N-terminal domain-containing protein n=1 Tax=Endocarpon pusillum (strain Z07020 / HMAS-L-300199) TaxID=1263415 RepID=U1FX16_ENDPU|nr:uncharacterized protein EPUS_05952 [Endocarpon pusillum Z07020]ERF69407.1 hypothetical protein EPUS_05952 [Endocarpon pusillum Z07020]
MDFRCVCGTHFSGFRRYSILKQMSQAPSVFARLLFKLGKTLSTFSRRVHYHEKELGESFHAFREQIRPNPLAANQNKALVASRAQQLLRLSDSIDDFKPTAIAFEQSIRWMQTTLPTTLLSITEHNICPVFSLRLTILQRRARNAWTLDCLRVSSYLVGLEDPSLEVQRMGELLRIRASKECWKGIAECNTAVEKAITAKTPAIEVELRLQQVQLSHLLDIALALGRGSAQLDTLLPTMTPEPASESVQKTVHICRRFPDTAGKFGGLVSKFVKFASEQRYDKDDTLQRCTSQLASLPQSCTYETRKTELTWGECVGGSVAVCELGGHPYSSEMSGCPECRRIKEVERVEEEARKAGECLFEERFLQAMKGLAK